MAQELTQEASLEQQLLGHCKNTRQLELISQGLAATGVENALGLAVLDVSSAVS